MSSMLIAELVRKRATGSFSPTSPFTTMSASSAAVKVLVIDAISKTELLSRGAHA